MSSYRDDIAQAERRIEQLEAELRSLDPAPSHFGIWLLSALIAVGSVALPAAAISRKPPPKYVQYDAPPPPAPPARARLFSSAAIEPVVDAHVLGSESEDLALVMWSADKSVGGALELVAIESKTFRPLWRSRPWPAGGSFEGVRAIRAGRNDELVAVADGGGTVRAWDAQRGKEVGSWDVRAPIRSICARTDGTIGVATTGGAVTSLRIGLRPSTAADDAETRARCRPPRLPRCEGEGGLPCISTDDTAATSPKLVRTAVYAAESHRLLVGTYVDPARRLGAPATSPPAPYAIAQTKEGAELWAGPITTAKGVVANDHVAWDGTHLVIAYKDGDFDTVVVCRESKTGRVLWTTTARTPNRGLVQRVDLTRSRAHVTVNGAMTVLDLGTGETLAVIEELDLSSLPAAR